VEAGAVAEESVEAAEAAIEEVRAAAKSYKMYARHALSRR